MSDRIFADNAPRYWAAGLPVIPLHPMDKRPVPAGWQVYAAQMPNAEEQTYWLHAYPTGNMGLVLGPQSGLCMIDIDTTNERVKQVIMDVLSPFKSPWQRVGAKGMVMAYRQPRMEPLKTFRIRTSQQTGNSSIVEGLSARTQVVLPPSIHPDTKRPYTANVELLEVLNDLPYLPPDIEMMLRYALEEECGLELSHSGWTRVTDFVSVGGRDTQMTRMAGLMAQGVTRGELTLMEAIGRMEIWHDTCVEKVAGDPIDIRKGVQNLIGFLARDVLQGKKTLPQGWDEGLTDELKEQLGLKFDHEHEEWSFEQILTYLQAEFQRHAPGTQGWINTVTYILERIGRSKSLDMIAEENILRYISESSGNKMTMGTLRKRLAEVRQGDIKGADHTEIAKAVIEEVNQYGELRYHNSKFWQWGGSHWEEKPEDELLRVIADRYGSLQAAKRRSDHVGILRTMSTLCKKDLRSSSVNGVNFANGYLTDDLELVPHSPDFGCTYTLPFRYLPEEAANARQWEQFLERIWLGDPDIAEKKAALQEAMAVTLFGLGPRYNRVILLYGLAKTGKSQLLKVVEALVPDVVRCAVAPNEWNDKFLPAQLANKLLNVAGELSEKKTIDGQRFKQIVSGEVITGQFKNGQPFEFRANCTHWFASNHLPKTEDSSSGFNRRWLILQFENIIRREEQIVDFGNILVADEREQIVAWAVQAMKRLKHQSDYTLPKSHEVLIEEVANLNNSVRFFIRESGLVRIATAPENGEKTLPHTSETRLHDAYSSFCLVAGGVKRVSLKQFRLRMKELEHEMGFKLRMRLTGQGMPEAVYENLTLVDVKAR